MKRSLLSNARKQHILNYDWSPQDDEASLPVPEEMEENANIEESKRITGSDHSPESDLPNTQAVDPDKNVLKQMLNINTEVDRQTLNEGSIFGIYLSQTDRTPVKESPNQEYSSVSDLTASLMSTSSDFVETPYDECLPDFEVDPKRNINSCKIDADSRIYACTKSSIESVLYDRQAVRVQGKTSDTVSAVSNRIEASANKQRVLLEEYGLTSDTREGARDLAEITSKSQLDSTKVLKDPMLNLELSDEANHNRILTESSTSKTFRETTTTPDDNANFSVVRTIHQIDENDENGNKEENSIRANTSSGFPAVVTDTTSSSSSKQVEDPNANIMAVADEFSVTHSMSTEDSNANTKVSSVIHAVTRISKDDTNGNTVFQNRSQLVSEFKERKAQEAAIKQKVLSEEYQPTMAKKNSINILRSKPGSSSVAARNKQKVLEFEYGMPVAEETDTNKNNERADWYGCYSRQLSGASTSSYKSFSGYERETSGSTAFTTPDEEIRPILIDQV